MDVERDFRGVLAGILQKDRRYSEDAYVFVRQALDYTNRVMGIDGHVTGRELLEGIRRFALDKYGPMSRFVFNEWGIRETTDFGNIVFNMVDSGLLGKTEEDSISDFLKGYDFSEAFEKPFE